MGYAMMEELADVNSVQMSIGPAKGATQMHKMSRLSESSNTSNYCPIGSMVINSIMLDGTMMKLAQDNASYEDDGQIKISEESPFTNQEDQAACHRYYR